MRPEVLVDVMSLFTKTLPPLNAMFPLTVCVPVRVMSREVSPTSGLLPMVRFLMPSVLKEKAGFCPKKLFVLGTIVTSP